MNPDAPQSPREELEARLTALLLGELSAEEAAALRQAIAQDAELAQLHERLQRTIGLVREAAASPTEQSAAPPEPLQLSSARRQQLLQSFKTVAPQEFNPPRRRELPWFVPMSVAAVLMAMVGALALLPGFWERIKGSTKALSWALPQSQVTELYILDAAQGARREDRQAPGLSLAWGKDLARRSAEKSESLEKKNVGQFTAAMPTTKNAEGAAFAFTVGQVNPAESKAGDAGGIIPTQNASVRASGRSNFGQPSVISRTVSDEGTRTLALNDGAGSDASRPANAQAGAGANDRAATASAASNLGRQQIQRKLDNIVLPEVRYENLPLGEVAKDLSDRSRQISPPGVNVVVESRPGTLPSQTGAAGSNPAPQDLNKAMVRIDPPLRDLRLADALDAVTKAADKPLAYSIENNGVVISPRGNESQELFTREFKVDPERFKKALADATGNRSSLTGGGGGGIGGGLGGAGLGGGGLGGVGGPGGGGAFGGRGGVSGATALARTDTKSAGAVASPEQPAPAKTEEPNRFLGRYAYAVPQATTGFGVEPLQRSVESAPGTPPAGPVTTASPSGNGRQDQDKAIHSAATPQPTMPAGALSSGLAAGQAGRPKGVRFESPTFQRSAGLAPEIAGKPVAVTVGEQVAEKAAPAPIADNLSIAPAQPSAGLGPEVAGVKLRNVTHDYDGDRASALGDIPVLGRAFRESQRATDAPAKPSANSAPTTAPQPSVVEPSESVFLGGSGGDRKLGFQGGTAPSGAVGAKGEALFEKGKAPSPTAQPEADLFAESDVLTAHLMNGISLDSGVGGIVVTGDRSVTSTQPSADMYAKSDADLRFYSVDGFLQDADVGGIVTMGDGSVTTMQRAKLKEQAREGVTPQLDDLAQKVVEVEKLSSESLPVNAPQGPQAGQPAIQSINRPLERIVPQAQSVAGNTLGVPLTSYLPRSSSASPTDVKGVEKGFSQVAAGVIFLPGDKPTIVPGGKPTNQTLSVNPPAAKEPSPEGASVYRMSPQLMSRYGLMPRPEPPAKGLPENSALGSTGYQPVPSGNLPDGTGATSMNHPSAGFGATPPASPAGRLPAPPTTQADAKELKDNLAELSTAGRPVEFRANDAETRDKIAAGARPATTLPVSGVNGAAQSQERRAGGGESNASAATQVQDARLLIEEGKLAEAEVKLKDAVAKDPANQAAHYYSDFVQQAKANSESRQREIAGKDKSLVVEHAWNMPVQSGKEVQDGMRDKIIGRPTQSASGIKSAESSPAGGLVSTMEPETVRTVERDRIRAEAMKLQYDSSYRKLKALPKAQLPDAIQKESPDPQLGELMDKLSDTERKLAVVATEQSANSPETTRLSALKSNLNTQIAARAEGVVSGLGTLAAASAERAVQLGAIAKQAREQGAEQPGNVPTVSSMPNQDDQSRTPNTPFTVGYSTARTNELEKKSRDLATMTRIKGIIATRILSENVDASLPATSNVMIVDRAEAESDKKPGLWERLRGAVTGTVERSARIEVGKDTTDIAPILMGVQNQASYDPYFIQTEFEKIKSKNVLYKVIEKLNLNEAWAKKRGTGGKLDTAETFNLLLNNLEVDQARGSSQIEIKFKSDKPDEAARIANTIAEVYRDVRAERSKRASEESARVLQKNVAEMDKKIALAKKELEALQKESKSEAPAAPAPKPASSAPVPQPEVQTSQNPFSTFSLNISDVSFKLAAASLEKSVMPDPATVRSEEFINAFDYRDSEPPPGAPIGFAWERARYPFAHNRDLLRFSVKTAAQGRQAGQPLNLVLLLDNSGSMERADRVRIIREALRVLAGQLQAQDKLSVIAFARTARLWVDGAAGNQAGQVAEQIGSLTPQGGTNLEDAMNLAYQTALRHYASGGVNRVVLLTDGAANLGNVEPNTLKAKVESHRKQGIALDCFGIGWDGYNDDLLEVLSRNGDGRYGFINTPEEAASGFAGQLAGALRVAASDVKVQVEFNPKRVTAYRQIGYAKHQLTKQQFRDNTVDAAEIGAAESGNALYAVEVNPSGEGVLAVVRVRFKVPGTGEYREQEWPVPFAGQAVGLENSSPAMRLAATASAFSEWLVSSPFAAEVTPDRLLANLSGVPEVYGADPRPKKLEWMVRQAKSVAGR